jgi:NAD(P)-dependent dehydrogenase (short-subunit alcohol dehydrogenase family)
MPTVLLTGASSGIGRACVERLAGRGWHVLAGARAQADRDALQSIPNVEPLELDVTDPAQIDAAAVRAGERLDALVNNAGIAVIGPLEALPVDEWRRQLEVNLVAQIAVTRALLPAVLNARGRIVNVTSIGGRVALPLFGPYAASKFGLEAATDALRRELRGEGVEVIAIEPGAIRTPIWTKGLERGDALVSALDDRQRARYGRLMDTIRGEAANNARSAPEPSAVADAVEAALTAPRPKTRYLVGREARIQATLGRFLPDRAMDALLGRALTGGGRRSARG